MALGYNRRFVNAVGGCLTPFQLTIDIDSLDIPMEKQECHGREFGRNEHCKQCKVKRSCCSVFFAKPSIRAEFKKLADKKKVSYTDFVFAYKKEVLNI